jgi:hypothetical protein
MIRWKTRKSIPRIIDPKAITSRNVKSIRKCAYVAVSLNEKPACRVYRRSLSALELDHDFSFASLQLESGFPYKVSTKLTTMLPTLRKILSIITVPVRCAVGDSAWAWRP